MHRETKSKRLIEKRPFARTRTETPTKRLKKLKKVLLMLATRMKSLKTPRSDSSTTKLAKWEVQGTNPAVGFPGT